MEDNPLTDGADETDVFVCYECEEEFEGEPTEHDGETYCQGCATDELSSCQDCNETCRTDEMNSVENGERRVCDDCRENYTTCDVCSQVAHEENITHLGDERDVCRHCYETRGGHYCDNCDEYVLGSCENCDDDDEEETSSMVHNYSYKPAPIFFKASPSEEHFYGIELEIENDTRENSIDTLAHAAKKEFSYLKSDGSLNNGFEIVTHPMTYGYIKSKADDWKKMLKTLVELGARSYNTTTCGMHVHISKGNFSTWHLYRFMAFFQRYKNEITSLSQRKVVNLNRWAAFTDENKDRLIFKAKAKEGNGQRYEAINLQNEHTVEIRIFRGTLKYESFMKNLEFCEALFLYTKQVNEETMSWEDFKAFSKGYHYLTKFIKIKNL